MAVFDCRSYPSPAYRSAGYLGGLDDKQDCENAAAKRWLAQQDPRLSALNVTVLGNDLYCHHPFCQKLLEQQFNFILVCRPESHTTLYEHLEGIDLPSVTTKRWTGFRREQRLSGA